MSNGYNNTSHAVGAQDSLSLGEASTSATIKNIDNFNIDISDMPTATTTRSFNVVGVKHSQFKIIALQNPTSSSDHTKYYNWKNKSFAAGHNSSYNDLQITLSQSIYRNNIIFPSGGGDYVIKLIPINGTTVKGSTSKNITKNISKATSNATVTFTPGSASSDNYTTVADLTAAAQPTVTSTGAVNSTANVEFNWDVTNRSHASYGYGLRLTGPYKKINDKYWYFETTENVVANGSGTDGADTKFVTVASTADLCVGMQLTYYKGTTAPENNAGSAVGTTTITNVGTAADSSGNYTITFSQAVGFDEGQTMTFRAYGSTYIKDAIGLDMQFATFPIVTPTKLTKTVRANVSASQNVTLTDTLGLAGGNHVTYKGLGVNNASANAVTEVTEDFDGSGTDGVIEVQLAQTLSAGTVLTFTGCHKVINFKGDFKIYSFPTANKTIYLDLDKLITIGAAS